MEKLFPEISVERLVLNGLEKVVLSTTIRKEFDNVWYKFKVIRRHQFSHATFQPNYIGEMDANYQYFIRECYYALLLSTFSDVKNIHGESLYQEDLVQQTEVDRITKIIQDSMA